MRSVRQKSGGFAANEDGTATVEAVLWLPVFLLFFCLVADAALVFYNKNQVHRLVQDTNRRLSVGRFASAAEAESFLEATITPVAPRATVDVDTDTSPGVVTSTVVLKTGDIVATGFFNAIADIDVTIRSQHLIEF